MDWKRRGRPTGFGVALRRVMDARAMRRWEELCRSLERAGYPRGHQTMISYINGEQAVEETFVRYVALALSLRKDERERLPDPWRYQHGEDDDGKLNTE